MSKGNEIRDPYIQGLKGIAIILVVFSHIYLKYNYAGALGVAIFLQISGLLACRKVTVEGKNYNFRYIFKRICRIYPLYFLVTVISALNFNPSIVYGVSVQESCVVFLCNLFLIHTLTPNNVFYGAFSQVGWYIPVVVISLLFTNLFARIWRKINIHQFVIAVILCHITEIICCIVFKDADWIVWFMYFNPFVRLVDFFIGGCIYVFADEGPKIFNYVIMVATVAMISLLLYSGVHGFSLYFYTIVWFVPVSMLLYGLQGENIFTKLLQFKPLVFVGNVSFEIFLLHLPILHYMQSINERINMGPLFVPIYILFVLMCCVFISRIRRRIA